MRQAFDAHIRQAGLAQVFEQVVRDGADMAVRPAGSHDHKIADRSFAAEIEGEGILGLHILKRGEDKAQRLVGGRTRFRDGYGRALGAGPRSCKGGQWSFSFRCLCAPIHAGHPQDMARSLTVSSFSVDFSPQGRGDSGDFRPCR